MLKKLRLIIIALTLCATQVILSMPAANAATAIAITSPSNGSTVTGSAFTVSGTATANRKISVQINGATVGTTTSDAGGSWSLAVTGQSGGSKTITATASADLLYTNVLNVGDFSSSRMSVINTVTGTQESSFSIFGASAFPILWKPNPNFTKAYGTSPYLGTSAVWVMDLSAGTTSTFIMSGTGANPSSIAYSADGSKVYIVDVANEVVNVYDTATNAVIGSPIAVGNGPLSATHMPNSPYITVVNSLDGTFSVIDTSNDSVVATVPVESGSNASAYNKEGTRLYLGAGTNGDVQVVNSSNGATLATLDGTDGSSAENMIVNDAGTRLYATHPSSNFVDVFDLNSGTLLTSITTPAGPWSVALNSDNSRLYVTNPNLLGGLTGTAISVIDTSSNTIVDTITPGGGAPLMGFMKAESASASSTITVASATLADTGNNILIAELLGLALLAFAAGSALYITRRNRSQVTR